jgi:mRNA interferase MazF
VNSGRNSILRGQIYWVNLDPSIGSEIKKTRPALILSNDQQNKVGQRFIVAPLTSALGKVYPFEAVVNIKGKSSKVMLDQIRTIDQARLAGYLESLSHEEMERVEKALKLVLDLY